MNKIESREILNRTYLSERLSKTILVFPINLFSGKKG